jgi:hypothetical protein
MTVRQSQQPTAEDWDQWLANPVTQAFLAELEEQVEDTKAAWAGQQYVGATNEDTLRMTLSALSQVDYAQRLIEGLESRKIVDEPAGEENHE